MQIKDFFIHQAHEGSPGLSNRAAGLGGEITEQSAKRRKYL